MQLGQDLARTLDHPTEQRSDLLDVNRLLRRIEFTSQDHVLSREVPNGLWIFYNPDSLVIVCYKDDPLGFPFWVSHRSTSTPGRPRTILSGSALAVLVPVLEKVVGWQRSQIREFLESHGFLIQEWDRVRTDWLTLRAAKTDIGKAAAI
jgi:hypothetical protein